MFVTLYLLRPIMQDYWTQTQCQQGGGYRDIFWHEAP